MRDKKKIWIILVLIVLIIIAFVLKYKLQNGDFMDFILGILTGLIIGNLSTLFRKKNEFMHKARRHNNV